MRKVKSVVLVVFMLLATSTIANADSGVKIKVNGELIANADAVIQNGTTLLPVRGIGVALGSDVTWDNATKTAIVEKDDTKVVVPIGERYILVNGQAKNLVVVAQVINGRTYLPLRVMGEALNCNINWDGATRTVEISNNSKNKDLFEVDDSVEPGPFFLEDRIYLTEGETVPVRVYNGGLIKYSGDSISCEWGVHNNENVIMVEGLHKGNSTLTLSNGIKSAKITVSVVGDTETNYLQQKSKRVAEGYDIQSKQETLIATEERSKEKYGIKLESIYEKNYIEKDDVLVIPIDSKIPLTGTFYLNMSGDAHIWPTMGKYDNRPALFIKGIQQTSTNIILRYINDNTNTLDFEKIEWAGEPKLIWEREDVRTTIDSNRVDTAVWEFEIRVVNGNNKELKKQNEERLSNGISYDLYLKEQEEQ